ncbi:hypothetical protein ABZT17_12115 [Streptomyces sp. NPDC005648]
MLINVLAVLFLLGVAGDLHGKARWIGAAVCFGLALGFALPLFLTWGI